MASLEKNGRRYRLTFFYEGRRFNRALHTDNAKAAEAAKHRVEDNLGRLKLGTLVVPHGVDLPTFLLADGKRPATVQVAVMSLAELIDRYLAGLPQGALEVKSLENLQLQFKHLQRHLPGIMGRGTSIQGLNRGHLQAYVAERATHRGKKGRPLSPVTIQKELAALRVAWNAGVGAGHVQGPFPNRDLKFPKEIEKPPFQTRAEIERRLVGVTDLDVRERHWECLYLTLPEIAELLDALRQRPFQPWLYPAVFFACHTGARRSEIQRLAVSDLDFEANVATIREKKKVRGKLTTRRVALSPALRDVLKAWLAVHPGGDILFRHGHEVRFSPKDRSVPAPLTANEAAEHLRRMLDKTRWRVVRGWHTFRHSFISNCVCRGIDERIIDQWVGHTSRVRQRYIHLLPSVSQESMKRVFGTG